MGFEFKSENPHALAIEVLARQQCEWWIQVRELDGNKALYPDWKSRADEFRAKIKVLETAIQTLSKETT